MTNEALSLADLIQRERDATGASYLEIANKCGLSKAKIGQLAITGAKYQVHRRTIEKLATGLRLPLSVVQHAALVSAGIADPSDGRSTRIELMASQLGLLDDDMLDAIAAMIDAAVRRKAANG